MQADTAAVACCLLAPEILRCICQFQDGVDAYVVPLLEFHNEKRWTRLLHILPRIADVDDVLGPWYDLYGTRHVLDVLRLMPRLAVLLSTHALLLGNAEVVQLMDEHDYLDRNDPHHLFLAACNGQLDVVALLTEKNYAMTSQAMDMAAMNGFRQVVEYLHIHRTEGCTTQAMDLAAGNGHLDVVQFLHANRKEGCNKWAMNLAAAQGHLNVVMFLDHHRSEGCTTHAMDDAAKAGHLDVVRFLHKYRHEGCTTDAMDGAAENGYLNVVKFLDENRLEGCTRRARQRAIARGFNDIVAYLDSHVLIKDNTLSSDLHCPWRWRDYFGGRP